MRRRAFWNNLTRYHRLRSTPVDLPVSFGEFPKHFYNIKPSHATNLLDDRGRGDGREGIINNMAETRIRPSDEVVKENIKKWNIPQPDREYTVLIHCTTYNHGKYIKDALEGFVNQKSTYSFCAIIIDDCITDNNQEIIKEYAAKYPDIIKPILLGENHMQRGILRDPYFEKWHQSAKYLAQCEGDDYWIDSLKLQRQVDFLETHQEYVAVAENGEELNITTNEKSLFSDEKERDLTIDEMVIKRRFPTASILYRSDIIGEDLKAFKITLDTGLWCYIASKGKVRYFENVSSVYRRGCGVTITSDPYTFALKCERMYLEIVDKLGNHFNTGLAYDAIYNGFLYSIPRYVHMRRFNRNFWNCIITCLKRRPLRFIAYMLKLFFKVVFVLPFSRFKGK